MKSITRWPLHASIMVVLVSVLTSSHAKEVMAVQVEKLLETGSSWDGSQYKGYPKGSPQLSVLKITIPPDTTLPWHEHPIPNVGYILSGKLTVEKKSTKESRVLTVGEVLPEMVNDAHRGYTGKEGVIILVFYAGVKGLPLTKLVP